MDGINGFKAAVTAFFACLSALLGWFGLFILAWIGSMIIDYATGTIAAWKAGTWSSSIACEGIAKKGGAIIVVATAGLLDYVVGLLVNNVPSVTLPFTYSVLLCPIVVAWYILTEIGSIIENAGKLGAPIPGWLCKAIAALKSGVDGAGDKITGDKVDKA